MTPKYFRCGESTNRCKLRVSGEIIKNTPTFECPCHNENCALYREEVSLIDGLTNGRSKLLFGILGVMIVGVALLLAMGGRDPSTKILDGLRERLAPLQSQLESFEAKAKQATSPSAPKVEIASLQEIVAGIEREAMEALAAKDSSRVADIDKKISSRIAAIQATIESLDKPMSGTGILAADARELVNKLGGLEDDTGAQFEIMMAKSPRSASDFDEFLSELGEMKNRAHRLSSPASSSGAKPTDSTLKKSLDQLKQRLQSTNEKLAAFVPPPPVPFQAEEADLVVAAPTILASDLVLPLLSSWTKGEPIEGEEGMSYFTSAKGGKILLKSVQDGSGFEMLANGECAIYFSDDSPSSADLAAFGGDFQESRSVAEVVALDALTLLSHPDSPISKVIVGSEISFPIAAGAEGSATREKAQRFGFTGTMTSTVAGEQGVLADRNLVVLGLYHREGSNLRAKRLAVQATEETQALKPSPFTIATEDYLYSFRIVAWSAPKTKESALALVKFTTSNEGQEVVAKTGYIDLRLKARQGDAPPEVLAALGAAIGAESVSSAIRLSTNLRFEVGKSDLDLKAQADIERLPRFVFEKYPTDKVVILGFTDSDGGPEINIPLSKDRAEVVAKELIRSKVDARAAGLGPAFPVDTNSTDSGKAKNRRAEVWVVRP